MQEKETGLMAIVQLDFEGNNKVEAAIQLIKSCEPPDGYYLAFSGGKDSMVIYDLTVKSGVKFDAHYNVSPIDPQQIHKFIKDYYPDVQWDYFARGFWNTVVKKGLPMRQSRWCCELIKEAGGVGRTVMLGLRAAESCKRGKRRILEPDRAETKMIFSPIMGWSSEDVWEYIKTNNLPYCGLYDKGFGRLGCVLCPFSRKIELEERCFPKIVKCWKKACDRIIAEQRARGGLTKTGKVPKNKFETGEELYQWWVKRK